MTVVQLSTAPEGVAISVDGVAISVHRVSPERPLSLEVVRVGDELLLYATGLCHPITIHDFSHAKT